MAMHGTRRHVLQLWIPASLEALAQASLGLIDQIIIGRLGESALAAAGLTNHVMLPMLIILGTLGSGASILVTHHHGRGDAVGVSRIASVSLLLGLVITIPLAGLLAAFPRGTLRLLGADTEVIATGWPLFRLLVATLPAGQLGSAAAGILRSLGDSRTPLRVTLVTALLYSGPDGCNAPGAALKSSWTTPGQALVRWPRIVGTNPLTHKPWAYSCKLDTARIVRDRIALCSGNDSYYRLPFEPGDERNVSQGNCGCTDGSCTHCCGCAQEYAFDFLEGTGEPIHAARGGVVVDVLEDKTKNCWGEEDWCPGNHVVIRHQDGTYGFYTHMPANTVAVSESQRVFRGQYLSQVGNTGNSSDPHLHFHVTDDSDGYGQTYEAKFQYFQDAPSSDLTSCSVPPEDDDDMGSNNELPLYTP